MKRTTLFVALTSAFSLSAFAHGQQSGAQSSQNDPSSSYRQSANERQTQSPDVVKQVQQKLSENGQDVGQPDGKMGPKTQAALKQFQQQNGFQPTGQIDAQTLAALNIGQSGSSATGGTAAPSQGAAIGSGSDSSNAGSSGASSNDPGSNDTGSNSSSSSSNK